MPARSDLLSAWLTGEHSEGDSYPGDFSTLSLDVRDVMSMALSHAAATTATTTTATTSGAAGTGATTLTMASLDTALDKLKATMEKHVEARDADAGDPTGWKMTSVRWLRENHPEFVALSVAHATLKLALSRMSYCEAETASDDGAVNRTAAYAMRDKLLGVWDRDEHDRMVQFLKFGGFSARMAALGKGEKAKVLLMPDPIVRTSTPPPQTLDDVVRELGNPTAGSW